jgi:CDP-diacylglycerol---serine O-phosphatidyltransferase
MALNPHTTDAGETETRRRGIMLLPNLLTTGTLFCGFYAIVAAMDMHFSRAGIAVFLAMVFDGLDGRVARWTNTQSEFGKEYDSLSDMVAFGMAPALIVYQWGATQIRSFGVYEHMVSRLGWAGTFFYAASAAFRLARFNTKTDTADKRYFEGLPSPSAAAAVAGGIWLISDDAIFTGMPIVVTTFVLTGMVGALMISRFSYWSGKEINFRTRVPWAYMIIVLMGYVWVVFSPVSLFATFGAYAASAPLYWIWRKLRRHPRRPKILPPPPQ